MFLLVSAIQNEAIHHNEEDRIQKWPITIDSTIPPDSGESYQQVQTRPDPNWAYYKYGPAIHSKSRNVIVIRSQGKVETADVCVGSHLDVNVDLDLTARHRIDGRFIEIAKPKLHALVGNKMSSVFSF